jgi:LAO/AO transport system kinase
MTPPSSEAAADALRSEAESYRKAILEGDRRAMARSITFLESTRPEQAALGQAVLESLAPESGEALRVGITGPPGVGKSTFIEALGLFLVEAGHRVAVLAVDPTSPITGGSILGDKTRMERLAREERAFIRPSPSGGSLGGVAHRTREAMLLCEAAGYDVVLVETVGIGQSEVSVASMVDFFLVLLQPGAGDDLQGLKKGVLELADALVVNKADGDSLGAATRTQAAHANALSLLRPRSPHWVTRVQSVSSLGGDGIPGVWATVEAHRKALEASGERAMRRREQARAWMWSLLDEGLGEAFRSNPGVAERLPTLEAEVEALERTPAAAARLLLACFAQSRFAKQR